MERRKLSSCIVRASRTAAPLPKNRFFHVNGTTYGYAASFARLQGQLSSSVRSVSTSSIPKIAQPSIWASIVPKPLRKRTRSEAPQATKVQSSSKEWNPATFFIVIFLLIGSQAIQMIALRNDFTSFSRKADAKMGLLREVIERIQKGEDVDVEKLLGTGNPVYEKEWEEVMREIAEEDNPRLKPSKEKGSRSTEVGDEADKPANNVRDGEIQATWSNKADGDFGDRPRRRGGVQARFY